jgi:hypothetical protein
MYCRKFLTDNYKKVYEVWENELTELQDGRRHKETHKPKKVYNEGQKDQRNKEGMARKSKKSPKWKWGRIARTVMHHEWCP